MWGKVLNSKSEVCISGTLLGRDTAMSAFATYLLGFILIAIGLAVAAYLLNVPTTWIGVGLLIAVGLGVVRATSRTRPRDPPA
jgi:hypothetical protein